MRHHLLAAQNYKGFLVGNYPFKGVIVSVGMGFEVRRSTR